MPSYSQTLPGSYNLNCCAADSDYNLSATDPTGNVGADTTIDELTIYSGGDTEKPQVEYAIINNGDAQRSMLNSMQVQFREPVNLDELLLAGTISDHIKLYDKTDRRPRFCGSTAQDSTGIPLTMP